MNDPIREFEKERSMLIANQGKDEALKQSGLRFLERSVQTKYSYNFSWMGRPIIQYPQDIVAMQEIVWRVKPDLVIETGVAHGGSLIFYASMLELLGGQGRVLGIDIDIRPHNRKAIEEHPMAKRISLLQGSSVDPAILSEVARVAAGASRILVCLDSNHTHDHVLAELQGYWKFVSKGSYLIVFDTLIEEMPRGFYPDRPWDRGNNPMTAVNEFLLSNSSFAVDEELDDKLLISVARKGYLKRV